MEINNLKASTSNSSLVLENVTLKKENSPHKKELKQENKTCSNLILENKILKKEKKLKFKVFNKE